MKRLRRIRRLQRHFQRITEEKTAALAKVSVRCAQLATAIENTRRESNACCQLRAEAIAGRINLVARRRADAWQAMLYRRMARQREEQRCAQEEREERRAAVVRARCDERMWQTLADRRARVLEDEAVRFAARELDELAMQDRNHRAPGRMIRPLGPAAR